ncbi:MAG: DUF4783 domain-containing protein [Ignavibacteria bacterium]|jgi:hypothetical protein|nr:DUF4783 domain-containing protein [Ignavibacteria bacterium]
MMKLFQETKLLIFSLFIFLFVINASAQSQDTWWKDKKSKNDYDKKKRELCKKTFKDIGSGFSYSSLGLINQYLGQDVYLDIIGTEKGYYNFSQAELIISEFMDYFKVVSVKYSRSYYKNSYAFVKGKYTYDIGSGRRDLKISISLKYRYDMWYIDQININ